MPAVASAVCLTTIRWRSKLWMQILSRKLEAMALVGQMKNGLLVNDDADADDDVSDNVADADAYAMTEGELLRCLH